MFSSPYFYNENTQTSPVNKKGKSLKDHVLMNGNFISGKQYYQHTSKNPNMFELLNEGKERW
jgi:hypothetical protein